MANKPSRKRGSETEEDLFVRKILELAAWAQENSRVVSVATVVAGLLVAAGLYYQNYRQGLVEDAAAQYQRITATMQAGTPPDTVASQLEGFVSTYGGTEYATRARLILARIALDSDRWDGALSHLEPLTGRSPDTPTGYAVGVLRAAALEGAGRTQEALDVLQRLEDGARFAYQRREAAADRARILAQMGRLAEAAEIYARLTEETPEDAPDAGDYALRLGEVRAAMASSPASSAGGAGQSGPDGESTSSSSSSSGG